MPKTLTLSKPEFSEIAGVRTVKWDLLDQDGVGYRISWIEIAFDTFKSECMAFACKYGKRGMRWTNYRKQAVSHNPDAALALNEVMMQLKEKHGYTYNTKAGFRLLPGEVVADGYR